MSLLFILLFGIGIDNKMSVSGQLSPLEKACYDLPEVKVTFTCSSSSLCHEKDFSRPCVPGCEGKPLPIVSYICRVMENQHDLNSTTVLWHDNNITSLSPTDPYCLPGLEIIPAGLHNTSKCPGINAHLENLRLLAVKSGEQNGTCNFLIMGQSKVGPDVGFNHHVFLNNPWCAETVVEIHIRDFKLSPHYQQVTPPILPSDPGDHHSALVGGYLGFLAVEIIVVILIIYKRNRQSMSSCPSNPLIQNPVVEVIEAVERIPEFPKPKRKMGGKPNICIVNNSQYRIEATDEFFETHLILEPTDFETLGSDDTAMTIVTILAYDNRNRNVKQIKFKTWTGFSWIIQDDGMKRQLYGSEYAYDEDPEQPLVPWAMDLEEHFREVERNLIHDDEYRGQEV